MSTTENFLTYKGMPTYIKARANGKWDYKNVLVYNTENEDISVTMDTYNGLSAELNESYQSADKYDFSKTVLPWKWDYNKKLSSSRFCLMPQGTTYDNIIDATYAYNFDVAGTLNINDQTKVIDGFSLNNYLTMGGVTLGSNTWEFVTKIYTQNVDTIQSLFTGYTTQYISLFLHSSGYLRFNIGTGSSWVASDVSGVTQLQANTQYWVKLSYDGTKVQMLLSTDGITYNVEVEYTTSSLNIPACPIAYGVSRSLSTDFFNGKIDFSETKIVVNNVDWWVPTFTKIEKRTINCTKVGSISINSNYIASNFTNSNYLSYDTPITITSSDDYELMLKIFYTAPNGTWQALIHAETDKYFATAINGTGYIDINSGNGSSWNANIIGETALQNNTEYYLKVVRISGVKTSYLSTDGITWTLVGTVNDTNAFTQKKLFIGTNPGHTQPFGGSIDLKEVYLKINNNIIWSSTSIITESLPGCTYNFTDDGSATTLNAFVVNNDQSVVLTPDNSYTNGWKLGTVSIPSHTVYTYNNGVWTEVL